MGRRIITDQGELKVGRREEKGNAKTKTQLSCRKGKATAEVRRWLDRQWMRLLPRIVRVMYGRHNKIIGKCIRGNIITKVILVKMIT